jgi:hypothetical protein
VIQVTIRHLALRMGRIWQRGEDRGMDDTATDA